jgi:hypothetical protein
MVLTGVLVPYILRTLYFFWFDQLDYFLNQQFSLPDAWFDFRPAPALSAPYFKLGLFAVLLLVVLFSHNQYLTKKTIQQQKKINLLFWGLLCGGLTLSFQPAIQLDHLLILAPPLGLLLAINFTRLNRNWSELLHLLLLLSAFALQFRHFLLSA